MGKQFVVVAGNIGAGKTTLTNLLASRLNWKAGYETVENNPFLADFYQDMKAWSFHLQIFFLGERAKQHRALAALSKSAIADRSIYEDAYIFARALLEQGNMTERDYYAYRRVYDLVVSDLPRPDLLIYVEASVPVLVEHIRKRGRNIESEIPVEYLDLLGKFYSDWIATFKLCPVVIIPSGSLNFVENERDIETVLDTIEQRLAGKEEVILT